MSFFRSVLLIGLVSLLASAGLLFIFFSLNNFSTGHNEFRGGYAVLATDVSVDDRTLAMMLDPQSNPDDTLQIRQAGLTGAPVSKSSLWVWLDNFDSLEAVPLDNYFSRVHSFDPRYDGYAEKLRDIFIKDGKRFVYLPITAGNWNTALLDNYLTAMLGDVSYSVDYYGAGRPSLLFFFIVYLAASVCLFVICFIKTKSRNNAKSIIVLVPVFASLAFFGAGGIGCAALFVALFIMLKEPLGELITLVNSYKQDRKPGKKPLLKIIKKEIITPYKYHIYLLPVFLAAFIIIVVFSKLNILVLLTVLAAALALFIFSKKVLAHSTGKRRQFIPVLIIKRRSVDFSFSVYMLPFTIAAFLALFFAPYQSDVYVSNSKYNFLIDEQDYYEHLAFQASFSRRKLEVSEREPVERLAKPAFFFDTDGLPSVRVAPENQGLILSDYLSFPAPLKNLIDFFDNVESGLEKSPDSGGRGGFVPELLSLLVLPFFILSGVFMMINNHNSAKHDLLGFKKFTYKLRKKGINLNKTPLYNGRNNKHLQKGAVRKQNDTLLARWKIQKDA